MKKFKVGDRVKVLSPIICTELQNLTGVIVTVHLNTGYTVKLDNGKLLHCFSNELKAID